MNLPNVVDRRREWREASPPPSPPPSSDLVWVPGGTYFAGCDHFYPEESPVRPVTVRGFWMECTPVTNETFGQFVNATGYVTTAEQAVKAGGRTLPPHGLVFQPPAGFIGLDDPTRWWAMVPNANWRAPRGPDEPAVARWPRHPVVQISLRDAQAYANWAGRALPTEHEWEFAARAGLDCALFSWGNVDLSEGGKPRANRWQGRFPSQNLSKGRFPYTTPVGKFPADAWGLYDMTGNVWEWTATKHAAQRTACCSQPVSDAAERYVLKGGSHLCATNYCLRYRPAAKSSQEADTPTSHIGFRCILKPPGLDSRARPVIDESIVM